MTPDKVQDGRLRLGQPELGKLAWAFAISVVIHLLCFGGYELGTQLGWWQMLHLPAWLQKTKMLASASARPKSTAPQAQQVPLMFVDVDPQLASTEAPKDAKFYSNKNSVAANPDADKETNVPKVTGKQTQVVKAEDVKRSPLDKLQPDFKALEEQRQRKPEHAKPREPAPPGDLAMAKPDLELRKDNGTAEQSRPRTIKEALRRLHRNQLVGEKMKQDGGVHRVQLKASFDAKATPFGVYDAALIEAVQSRWYDLLDNIGYDGYRRGKVTLDFRLMYDGRVTDVKILDNSVGDMLGLLCQKAVLDPAPYDRWPREMRLMVDKDYREVTFTFYYN